MQLPALCNVSDVISHVPTQKTYSVRSTLIHLRIGEIDLPFPFLSFFAPVEQATRIEPVCNHALHSAHAQSQVSCTCKIRFFQLTFEWYSKASSSPWLKTHFLLRFCRITKQQQKKFHIIP